MANPRQPSDKRIDELMGLVLRSGVILAASTVFFGGVIYLLRHASPTMNYTVFQGESEMYRTVPGIISQARALSGRGLIQLGLLLLIATPVARVMFSAGAFFYQRDWKYVTFTLLVLVLLLYSLFGHSG